MKLLLLSTTKKLSRIDNLVVNEFLISEKWERAYYDH